ncbi:hypothetical protein [Streptomyces sp. NRRL S-646]|uniref:hypothetical protein n=1 Tax=Streptomyces sp. NRRL S-646 TaxID=1463917 RepID=UPI0013317869|nr:hypothetical protein [Streptomyces sp. NRRL S-646]
MSQIPAIRPPVRAGVNSSAGDDLAPNIVTSQGGDADIADGAGTSGSTAKWIASHHTSSGDCTTLNDCSAFAVSVADDTGSDGPEETANRTG